MSRLHHRSSPGSNHVFSSSAQQAILLLLFSAAAVFLMLKAATADITHDEAYSFHNAKKFWYAEALCTGNTHWLNSAAMKAAITLGLENAWQLRWLSILSSVGLLATGFLWLRTIPPLPLKWFAFALVFLNPYVLDYLVLARGYAPGLLFESLGLAFLIAAVKNKKRKSAFGALLCAGFAAIANFSFIYFFAAFSLVYFFIFHFQQGNNFFKSKSFYVDLLYVSLICSAVALAFRFILKCSGDVTGAGEKEYLKMFYVFIDGLLYNNLLSGRAALHRGAAVLSGLLFLISCYGVLFRRKHASALLLYSSMIYIFMNGIMLFTRIAFDVVFPYYRAALFLFPVTAPMVVCFFCSLRFNVWMKNALALIAGSALTVNFLWSADVKTTLDYREQADARLCFEKVSGKVGLYPDLYGVYINYYQQTEKYKYNFEGRELFPHHTMSEAGSITDLRAFDYLVLSPPYRLDTYRTNGAALKVIFISPVVQTAVVKVEK